MYSQIHLVFCRYNIGIWHRFTLNPGLRRTKDYEIAKPFFEKGSEEVLSGFYFEIL